MHGIYLHVLADALGSIGVIISSVLVKQYNLSIADPICSILISGLILLSARPLLEESISILLQRAPPVALAALPLASSVEGVVSLESRTWEYRGGEYISSVRLRVEEGVDEQRVLAQSTLQRVSIEIRKGNNNTLS
jgi:zinc transporter 5/7